VSITGTNPTTIEAARAEPGGDVVVIRADAGDVVAQRLVADAVRHAFGGLDILFVNAGVAEFRPIELNTSINARIGMPSSSVYGATKAGLVSPVRTLSSELISRGIRVNAVSPGAISTPLYGKLGLPEADLKAVAASIKGQVPAGRFGMPAEIAQAVVRRRDEQSLKLACARGLFAQARRGKG